MAKVTKKTNPMLIALIQDLKRKSQVNLDRIEKYIKENETALIPGKVLSSGNLTKKISIAAWSFSEKSLEKIKKAGGKHMSIEDLVKSNPKAKGIRILGQIW